MVDLRKRPPLQVMNQVVIPTSNEEGIDLLQRAWQREAAADCAARERFDV